MRQEGIALTGGKEDSADTWRAKVDGRMGRWGHFSGWAGVTLSRP